MISYPVFRSLWLGALLGAGPAVAHDAFESTTVVRLEPATLVLEVTMAPSISLVSEGAPFVTFDPEELETVRPQLLAAAPKLFDVSVGGKGLTAHGAEVALTTEGDVEFRIEYPRPAAGPVEFFARHVTALGYGYGSLLVCDFGDGKVPTITLLMADDAHCVIDLPAPASPAVVAEPARQSAGFSAFLHLGFEHILTGYDHLFFLCGLVVVCRRLRSVVGIITCFTLAHSLTLALAALDVFALPGPIVEPLIAGSILFVGVENLLRRGEPKGRWALTFAFGLIHGFGFAGVLREIGLGTAGVGIAVPLFSFNLGVELGQLALVAVALPLLFWLRTRPAFVRYGQPAISVIVAGFGLYWLLQRTVFS